MKDRIFNTINFLLTLIFVGLLIFVVSDANAQMKKMKPTLPQQSQGQSQDQDQKQDQNQSQTADASNQNNVSLEGGDLNFQARKREAAGNDAPSVYASGVCGGAVSGGLSLPGGNASFGKSYQDDECNMRETARMLYEFGERTMAIELLCMTPAASNLGSCKPMQDYNKEMKDLKAQHQMAIEDSGRMEEQARELREERDQLLKELDEKNLERVNRLAEAAGPTK